MGTQTHIGATDSLPTSRPYIDANFDSAFYDWGIVATSPPAGFTACDNTGNSSNGSGTDVTTAMQALVNEATDRCGRLIIPSGTYILSDTITVDSGLEIYGIGGRNAAGTPSPPAWTWAGAANGGPILAIESDVSSIAATKVTNLCLSGRTDGTNLPLNALIFRHSSGSGQASADSGTELERVLTQMCAGDGIRIEGSSTNFSMRDCRADGVFGYWIYLGPGIHRFTIDGHSTWTAASGNDGMIFADGETSTCECDIKILGFTAEVNTPDGLGETFDIGSPHDWQPMDRRGVIRLGVRTADAYLTHRVFILGWKHAVGNVGSHSLIQVTATSGSPEDHFRRINVMVVGADGVNRGNGDDTAETGEVTWIGGSVPYRERMSAADRICIRHGLLIFNPGLDATINRCSNWVNGREFRVRGFAPETCTVAELIDSTWLGYGYLVNVSDCNTTTRGATVAGGGSNNVLARWNGANWVVV